MPAVSEKQRRYLEANKGHAWVKRHHFDHVEKNGKRENHITKKLRSMK